MKIAERDVLPGWQFCVWSSLYTKL